MKEEILNGVVKCVAEVLALQPDGIQAESRLIGDLGADSLDLVELMYLLEQQFSIRLDKKDMSLSAQLGLPDHEIHLNEVLTEQALQRLRERFPESRDLLVEGVKRNELASLLTVAEVARSIERKVTLCSTTR